MVAVAGTVMVAVTVVGAVKKEISGEVVVEVPVQVSGVAGNY